MFSEGNRRSLVHDKTRPVQMNTRLNLITTWFRVSHRDDTIPATMTFHLVTYDFTDIFDIIETEGFLTLVIDINEKVVPLTLLFHDVEFLTTTNSFYVLFVKHVQFIKWHGKDTTVHEHM